MSAFGLPAEPLLPRRSARVAATYLRALAQQLDTVSIEAVADAVECLRDARARGARVFVLGNGGSAATASHLVCDLTKSAPDGPGLRAQSLTDNASLLSALANDTSYAEAFARQVEMYVDRGDVVVAISASGNSANVVEALHAAGRLGATRIALVGFDGGEAARSAEVVVHVASHDYGRVEDVHAAVAHAIGYALRDQRDARPAAAPVEQIFRTNGAAHRSVSAAFVDRDGVINVNRNGHVRSWDEFEVLPGALEALALMSQTRRVFVVTNQSVVGRGLASSGAIMEVHARLASLVSEQGGSIEAVLTCPHAPSDACACRKPEPGLLLRAADRFGLSLRRSVMIGDHLSDLDAADRAGSRSILALSGRLQACELGALPSSCIAVVADLAAAARLLADRP